MPPVIWAVVAAYLVVISAVAVGVTIYDKNIAIKNGRIEEAASKKNAARSAPQKSGKGKPAPAKSSKAKGGSGKSEHKAPSAIRRVPEKNLLIISALGGSIAMLITMRVIRHKTQHAKFMVGIPAIIVAQCALVVALVVLL